MIEDNVLHHRWYNKKAGFFYLSWHCVYVDIHSFKCCSLKSNIFQNRYFFRYSHTGKTNILAFWCQKLDQYLLNNLHIIRGTITLNKVKKKHNFQIVCRMEFPSDRSLKTYWISYCIIILFHIKTSFELMKNSYLSNIFLS